MADTITPNISRSLYRFLCKNIVGSEDYVKRFRMMNAVRDDESSTNFVQIITSGSFGEGLEMRGSDLDIMHVNKEVEVYEDAKTHFNPNKTYFYMDRDNVKPGFTQLRLEHSRTLNVFGRCVEHNGKYYLSNAIHKQIVLTNTPQIKSTIHGPCLSDKNGNLDYALCYHCKTWVSPAGQWKTRSRNVWPSHEVKQSIIKHGVLVVPIGVKCSPKEDIEWRVSFSVAEKVLINTFTHTQLLCYALLKVILKDVIATYSECTDLICSYFLKTIIFWISEELPQSIWKPDNLIPCFMRCLSRLVYCVEYSVCTHYFIPEINMFENKIEGCAREILLKNLCTLFSFGWRCILFSDQISNFTVSMWNFPIEPYSMVYTKQVGKILKSLLLYRAMSASGLMESNIFNRSIIQTVHCLQSSTKDVYKYYLSKSRKGIAQCITLDSTLGNNKYRYREYTLCLSNLLNNVFHDALSGWLMVANLFYKTKQYRKALHIIRYSISKCTPEKLYYRMAMSDIHYQCLKLQTFQKMSFVCLLKIMFVDFIQFDMNFTLIPDELLMDELSEIHKFPSSAFAYFLKFLCHFHLKNVRQCQDVLQRLQLVIKERFLIGDIYSLANAYIILGIASQLFGDKESARQAFLQSVYYTRMHHKGEGK